MVVIVACFGSDTHSPLVALADLVADSRLRQHTPNDDHLSFSANANPQVHADAVSAVRHINDAAFLGDHELTAAASAARDTLPMPRAPASGRGSAVSVGEVTAVVPTRARERARVADQAWPCTAQETRTSSLLQDSTPELHDGGEALLGTDVASLRQDVPHASAASGPPGAPSSPSKVTSKSSTELARLLDAIAQSPAAMAFLLEKQPDLRALLEGIPHDGAHSGITAAASAATPAAPEPAMIVSATSLSPTGVAALARHDAHPRPASSHRASDATQQQHRSSVIANASPTVLAMAAAAGNSLAFAALQAAQANADSGASASTASGPSHSADESGSAPRADDAHPSDPHEPSDVPPPPPSPPPPQPLPTTSVLARLDAVLNTAISSIDDKYKQLTSSPPKSQGAQGQRDASSSTMLPHHHHHAPEQQRASSHDVASDDMVDALDAEEYEEGDEDGGYVTDGMGLASGSHRASAAGKKPGASTLQQEDDDRHRSRGSASGSDGLGRSGMRISMSATAPAAQSHNTPDAATAEPSVTDKKSRIPRYVGHLKKRQADMASQANHAIAKSSSPRHRQGARDSSEIEPQNRSSLYRLQGGTSYEYRDLADDDDDIGSAMLASAYELSATASAASVDDLHDNQYDHGDAYDGDHVGRRIDDDAVGAAALAPQQQWETASQPHPAVAEPSRRTASPREHTRQSEWAARARGNEEEGLHGHDSTGTDGGGRQDPSLPSASQARGRSPTRAEHETGGGPASRTPSPRRLSPARALRLAQLNTAAQVALASLDGLQEQLIGIGVGNSSQRRVRGVHSDQPQHQHQHEADADGAIGADEAELEATSTMQPLALSGNAAAAVGHDDLSLSVHSRALERRYAQWKKGKEAQATSPAPTASGVAQTPPELTSQDPAAPLVSPSISSPSADSSLVSPRRVPKETARPAASAADTALLQALKQIDLHALKPVMHDLTRAGEDHYDAVADAGHGAILQMQSALQQVLSLSATDESTSHTAAAAPQLEPETARQVSQDAAQVANLIATVKMALMDAAPGLSIDDDAVEVAAAVLADKHAQSSAPTSSAPAPPDNAGSRVDETNNGPGAVIATEREHQRDPGALEVSANLAAENTAAAAAGSHDDHSSSSSGGGGRAQPSVSPPKPILTRAKPVHQLAASATYHVGGADADSAGASSHHPLLLLHVVPPPVLPSLAMPSVDGRDVMPMMATSVRAGDVRRAERGHGDDGSAGVVEHLHEVASRSMHGGVPSSPTPATTITTSASGVSTTPSKEMLATSTSPNAAIAHQHQQPLAPATSPSSTRPAPPLPAPRMQAPTASDSRKDKPTRSAGPASASSPAMTAASIAGAHDGYSSVGSPSTRRYEHQEQQQQQQQQQQYQPQHADNTIVGSCPRSPTAREPLAIAAVVSAFPATHLQSSTLLWSPSAATPHPTGPMVLTSTKTSYSYSYEQRMRDAVASGASPAHASSGSFNAAGRTAAATAASPAVGSSSPAPPSTFVVPTSVRLQSVPSLTHNAYGGTAGYLGGQPKYGTSGSARRLAESLPSLSDQALQRSISNAAATIGAVSARGTKGYVEVMSGTTHGLSMMASTGLPAHTPAPSPFGRFQPQAAASSSADFSGTTGRMGAGLAKIMQPLGASAMLYSAMSPGKLIAPA